MTLFRFCMFTDIHPALEQDHRLPKEKPVSPREVAALIGQGKSNAEMADLLVVSKRTVETYVSRVLSKLGLASRSQIAL